MINEEMIVDSETPLIEALSLMDSINRKLLFVCDGRKFVGVVSIGDVQRALLKKQDLNRSVSEFMRSKITYARDDEDRKTIKNKMRLERIESMPIVNNKSELIDIIEWLDLFRESENNSILNDFSVVIMAGGKGTRLLPLTNIIPKPLIPISDKTIIEEILDRYISAGCKDFYISVNYKTDTIKKYLSTRYSVKYIQEEKPLGTAGSLYLLKNIIHSTFIVSNCDTIADIDFKDLIEYHKTCKNVITVVSVIKKLAIPYGTIETGIDGVLLDMKEKPEMVYQINSGIYVLQPEVLEYISDNEFMNVPDLIQKVKNANKKVGVFPISEGSWYDMGNWEEYLHLVNKYLINQKRK